MTHSLVEITDQPGRWLGEFISQRLPSQTVVVTDTNTRLHCYPLLAKQLPDHHLIVLPAGEEYKTLDTCMLAWQQLTALGTDRHALVVVIGGGVLGDLMGFCAATYKRGIDFVLVPTTLLAQVDASVGGKLGIDFQHFKNHIGVFQQPVATLVAPLFLATLPPDETKSGFAEIIKHCLLDSAEAWEQLRQVPYPPDNWQPLIAHSISYKSRIIAADPHEKGLRKVLNLGHSVGHAVETASLSAGKRLLHGEAIAIGLLVEAHIATVRGLLPASLFTPLRDYVTGLYGRKGTDLPVGKILENIYQDKKNKGNKLMVVLLEKPGSPRWDVDVTAAEVESSWQRYASGQM